MEDTNGSLELLEYKLEEVQNFHLSDFGELLISYEKKEDFNAKITDPIIDRKKVYEEMIRFLYMTLINNNLERIEKSMNSVKIKIVDFSEIKRGIQEVKNELKKQQLIDDLNELYTNKVQHLKWSFAHKKSIQYNNIILQVIIAVASLLLGMYIQKISGLL